MKKHEADLTTYKNKFLECRPGMSGHAWRWQTDFRILRNTKGEISEFSRSRRCTRCHTESIKVYNGHTGRLLRRTYVYPDGYMIDSTKFQLEPGQAALESLRRALDGGRAQEEE